MATFNSDIVTARGASPFTVAPGTIKPILGSVVIASNTTIATNDTMPLFYMGGNSSDAPGHIVAFWLDLPAIDGGSGLTLSLLDSNTTPTTIISASTAGQAGGWLDETNAVHATIGTAVNYVSAPTGSLIYLKAAHAATNTSGASALTIYFGFMASQD